jgi:hypothetical protein
MIPPVNVTPAPQLSNPTPINHGVAQAAKTVARSDWKTQSPANIPDLQTTPKLRIAQSELPGSTQTPPTPSIRDTGNGYPSRIPQNYVGPAISFGNGASYGGVVSRFPFSENYSIRPSAVFGSNGTILRVPITYDFILGEKEPFERNPVVTFHAGGGLQFSSLVGTVQGDKFSLLGTAGVDINLFDGIALLADYNTNFGNVSGATIGLGFEF